MEFQKLNIFTIGESGFPTSSFSFNILTHLLEKYNAIERPKKEEMQDTKHLFFDSFNSNIQLIDFNVEINFFFIRLSSGQLKNDSNYYKEFITLSSKIQNNDIVFIKEDISDKLIDYLKTVNNNTNTYSMSDISSEEQFNKLKPLIYQKYLTTKILKSHDDKKIKIKI